MVFIGRHENPPIDLVKRLIGLPGDTVSMRNGELFINGVKQVEPYVRHTSPGSDGSHPWMDWQLRYLTGDVDQAKYGAQVAGGSTAVGAYARPPASHAAPTPELLESWDRAGVTDAGQSRSRVQAAL